MDKQKIRDIEWEVTESKRKVGVMHTLFSVLETENHEVEDTVGMFYGLTIICKEVVDQLEAVTDTLMKEMH